MIFTPTKVIWHSNCQASAYMAVHSNTGSFDRLQQQLMARYRRCWCFNLPNKLHFWAPSLKLIHFLSSDANRYFLYFFCLFGCRWRLLIFRSLKSFKSTGGHCFDSKCHSFERANSAFIFNYLTCSRLFFKIFDQVLNRVGSISFLCL